MKRLHSIPRLRPRRYTGHRLFFPLACAYAAVVAPLSVYEMTTETVLLTGLTGPREHAHELLFGFALAVVAGFLVNRARLLKVALLLALWTGARGAFLLAPAAWVSTGFNAAFALALTVTFVPPFVKSAKKWRNRALGPILVVATGAAVGFHAGTASECASLQYLALHEGVLALALLMLFMGGRVIAPATAGHIRIRGGHLQARVQPRLEGALLILMATSAVAASWRPLWPAAGATLIGAGVVALVRLARWRLWWCIDRDDLTGLGVGYAWLAIGLLLTGCALALGTPALPAAIHAITIGALGTLTITMMARTSTLRAKRDPTRLPGVPLAIAMISISAVLRIGAPTMPSALVVASLLWSAAFAITLATLVRIRAPL